MKNRFAWLAICILLVASLLGALVACTDPGPDEDTTAQTTADSPADSIPASSETAEGGTVPAETELEAIPDTPYPIDLCRLGGVNIAEFSIVCAADLPTTQQTTLDCLVARIAEATGYTLPIITPDQSAEHEIVFGNGIRENAKVTAAVAEIRNDGYALVMDEGDLYIAASTERGVVYGAYGFMEDYLGVRFYAADCITCKENKLVDIPGDLKDVYSPAFYYRGGNWKAEWGAYGYAAAKANEGDMRSYGDEDILYSFSGHYISMYIDSVDGKWDDGNWASPNPCLTKEGVYETILNNLLLMIDSAPYDSIRIGQNDNVGHCTCDNCKAINEQYQSEGATHMWMVNRLAAALQELRPGVKLQTYAYTFSNTPPVGMKMEENVIINYCFNAACFAHAINDPACEKNAQIVRELTAWSEVASCITIYDYGNNFSSNTYVDSNLFALWDTVHFLAEMGIEGYGTETWVYPGGDFDELRTYLIGKVMWDPMMTKEEYLGHMNEFMEAYYGDAAPYLLEYIQGITESSLTPGYCSLGEYSGCTAVYTPMDVFYHAYDEKGKRNNDFTNAMLELWEKARATALSEEELARVERASFHFYRWCSTALRNRDVRDYFNELSQKLNISILGS